MNHSPASHAAACAAAIEAFERFAGRIVAGGEGDLHRLVIELEAFARFHAHSEEASMLDCGYDRAEPEDHALHRAAHVRLSEGLGQIQRLLADDGAELGTAIAAFVSNWVGLHRLASGRLLRHCDAAATRGNGERLQLAA